MARKEVITDRLLLRHDALRAALVEDLEHAAGDVEGRSRGCSGSPITMKRYGGASTVPSTSTPTRPAPGVDERRARDHPDRRAPTLEISMASAPASRSSCRVSSSTSEPTWPSASVMVSSMPGSAGRQGAREDPEHPGAVARLLQRREAVVARHPVAGLLQLARLGLEPGAALGHVVEDAHQVGLAQPGQTGVLGRAHLDGGREAEHPAEQRRHGLGPGRPRVQRRAAAGPGRVPARGLALRVGTGVRTGAPARPRRRRRRRSVVMR